MPLSLRHYRKINDVSQHMTKGLKAANDAQLDELIETLMSFRQTRSAQSLKVADDAVYHVVKEHFIQISA